MTAQHAQILDAVTLRSVAERMDHRGEHGSARMARFLARGAEMCAPIPEPEATAAIAAAVDRPNYDELDPGIRATVRALNDAGFYTTDSGDGVSKPREWYEGGHAIPCPHVVVSASPASVVHDALAIARLLGPEWEAEATFVASSGTAYVFVSRPLPVEI